MKKLVSSLMLAVMTCLGGHAQTDADALRYSRTFIGGTARSMAMGGAFGALGADFSTASTNPAGLGLYSRSELTITPTVFIGRTVSDFKGIESVDSKSNFNFGSIGMVMASPRKSGNSIVKHYQFAFGVNRINNFNNRMLMEGFNGQNSVVDTYVDGANGIFFGDIEDDDNGFYAYDLNPAWYTFMIDTVPGFTDRYFGAVPPGGGVYQRQEITSWGAMNEMLFAFSANFADRVYVGASFGFPFLRYYEEALYTEIDRENALDDFNRLSIYDELYTRGTGFNVKFGTVVRVTDYLRMGAAIHSPTWYNNMTDEWYSEFYTSFDDGETFTERTPFGAYDYQLETPWKFIGSASGIIQNVALVSLEYEYIDYSRSRLRSRGYNFYDENSAISNNYASAHSIRLGAEYRVDNVGLRAGGGYNTSPFADGINTGNRFYYSAGVGFRGRNFFADFAFVQSFSNEDFYLYGSENVYLEPISNKYSTYNILMTLGFRL